MPAGPDGTHPETRANAAEVFAALVKKARRVILPLSFVADCFRFFIINTYFPSRDNTRPFLLGGGEIGFVWVCIGFVWPLGAGKLGLIGFVLALNWVCFFASGGAKYFRNPLL
jgi:hypothetical protein